MAPAHPKSKLNTAVEYTLTRWLGFGRYILNGELEIDMKNRVETCLVLIENQIRLVAPGEEKLFVRRQP